MKIYQTLIKRALKPQVPSLSEVGSLILQGDSMSVTQSFIASATHLVGELWRVESPRDRECPTWAGNPVFGPLEEAITLDLPDMTKKSFQVLHCAESFHISLGYG